ncbi:hypothetical protein RRG08_053274 [Elysia crispata]|uniref:Uncharacterized protein n=1 Tax=Elysia crispata TaxID=231223 RepID=A0AAE1E1K7_9GAST|nr:hypothetical protein RRG08_053274 [Elysia crispata]
MDGRTLVVCEPARDGVFGELWGCGARAGGVDHKGVMVAAGRTLEIEVPACHFSYFKTPTRTLPKVPAAISVERCQDFSKCIVQTTSQLAWPWVEMKLSTAFLLGRSFSVINQNNRRTNTEEEKIGEEILIEMSGGIGFWGSYGRRTFQHNT